MTVFEQTTQQRWGTQATGRDILAARPDARQRIGDARLVDDALPEIGMIRARGSQSLLGVSNQGARRLGNFYAHV